MEALKKFACHAGIAFQIKDDLLDVEGDQPYSGNRLAKMLKTTTLLLCQS